MQEVESRLRTEPRPQLHIERCLIEFVTSWDVGTKNDPSAEAPEGMDLAMPSW